MKVRQLMRPPLACRPGTDLATVSRLMRLGRCGYLPVIGRQNEVVGWITEADVASAVAAGPESAAHRSVASVMSRHVAVCGEEESVEHALVWMRGRRLPEAPVVDRRRRLRGVVTLRDVVAATRRGRTLRGRGAALDE